MADPFIAEVQIFAGNFAPRSWAFCSGQLLAISSNTALFSIVGTTYGGDGRVTFGLPDLRGRSPRGEGTGPGLANVRWGQRAGLVDHTLTTNQLGSHSHVEQVSSSDASTGDAGVVAQAEDIFRPSNDAGTLVASATTKPSAGGDQSFSILNPFLGLNYIIALQGIYPSRS